MTTFANFLAFDATTDAAFRAWGSGIAAGLAGAGLVQTADTGQINWATVTRSVTYTGNANAVGYEIYRFSDSLQATKPVFIKVEYGNAVNGSSLSYFPAMWITVGTGTNGAGTLTGVVGTRRNFMQTTSTGSGSSVAVPTASSHCYYSGDTASIQFALGIDPVPPTMNMSGSPTTVPVPNVVCIERTRNLDGTYNGDGVVFAFMGSNGLYASSWSSQTGYQIISFGGAGVGAVESILPNAMPGSAFLTGVSGSVIATYPIPVASPAIEGQMLGLLACYNNDIGCATIITVPVFGTNHTYLSCAQVNGTGANNHSGFASAITTTTTALLMRYE